ncbi:MAG: Fe-S oxidoreductase, partial [Actinomycetota bacterium]
MIGNVLRAAPLFILAAVAAAVAGPRALALVGLVRSGQPNPERRRYVMKPQYPLLKIIGQKKLLQWTGPGIAHAFTFWGFL